MNNLCPHDLCHTLPSIQIYIFTLFVISLMNGMKKRKKRSFVDHVLRRVNFPVDFHVYLYWFYFLLHHWMWYHFQIIFLDLVEGKYKLWEMTSTAYNHKGGKNVGLLLRKMDYIWNTKIVLLLDDGFCVLVAIIMLAKSCLYGVALTKRR